MQCIRRYDTTGSHTHIDGREVSVAFKNRIKQKERIELVSLIDMTSYPIIITANDAWDRKLSPLRQKCEMIQLKEIDYQTIKQLLFEILRKEKMFIKNDILTSIAIKAKGDIRAAINDLQAISEINDPAEL